MEATDSPFYVRFLYVLAAGLGACIVVNEFYCVYLAWGIWWLRSGAWLHPDTTTYPAWVYATSGAAWAWWALYAWRRGVRG